ncbi:MAG: hypothetical protein MIO92_07030, partial [Methanosarcinaceae archaeon]|nr:hypothetical protein [Methanosarcinaceae archaeon]
MVFFICSSFSLKENRNVLQRMRAKTEKMLCQRSAPHEQHRALGSFHDLIDNAAHQIFQNAC